MAEIHATDLAIVTAAVRDTAPRKSLWRRIEPTRNLEPFNPPEQRRILAKLNAAEGFEKFLHTRYLGQKRFSLEGAETLIPLLDRLVERGADSALKEIVLGMAHRGRLNVLAHTKVARCVEPNLVPRRFLFVHNAFPSCATQA